MRLHDRHANEHGDQCAGGSRHREERVSGHGERPPTHHDAESHRPGIKRGEVSVKGFCLSLMSIHAASPRFCFDQLPKSFLCLIGFSVLRVIDKSFIDHQDLFFELRVDYHILRRQDIRV